MPHDRPGLPETGVFSLVGQWGDFGGGRNVANGGKPPFSAELALPE
jgi:hypothetical protein